MLCACGCGAPIVRSARPHPHPRIYASKLCRTRAWRRRTPDCQRRDRERKRELYRTSPEYREEMCLRSKLYRVYKMK